MMDGLLSKEPSVVPNDLQQLFQATYDFVYANLSHGGGWPDAVAVIESRQESFRNSYGVYSDVLPILTCSAIGGDARQAIPLAAAWVLYDIASEIFDDLQDRDGKDRLWNRWQPSRAMSVGLGMVAYGNSCLAHLQTPPNVLRDILTSWSGTLAHAAREQWQDTDRPTLEQYFQQTVTKSGLIFAVVAEAGAKLNSSHDGALQSLYDYGMRLGMATQIWDDCLDLYPDRAKSDVAAGVHTLPVLYALSLQEHLLYPQLNESINLSRKLASEDVKTICCLLEEMGAISYCAALIKAYELKALKALAEIQDSQWKTYLVDYVSAFLLPIPSE